MTLVVDSLSVVIHDQPILRDVDLTLADHEIVAVLGPSGSGKTTLLRVIAGLQNPSAGSVTLEGVVITNQPVHRRGIGLMFQDHALFPHRNVYDNVAFGLRMARRGRPEIRARVHEVLDLVGLDGFGSRRIDGLSGGERQRVALARALAPRPGVLLLDEPLGSLDRALRERLVDDLAAVLRTSGVSAIYVTHDQAEAFAMGHRLAVMREGTIAQAAPPEQVWTAPIDAGVARIVGPVTLVPVEVDSSGMVPEPWRQVITRAEPSFTGPGFIVIRADTFSLQSPEAGSSDLEGEVLSASFRGDHHLVVARLDQRPAHEITVAHRGSQMPKPGDRVGLRVVHPPSVAPPAP